MKILNLYAGIGGNRNLWGDEHSVTAVENSPQIAAVYQNFFPNDRVIVGDAHDYLLKCFSEFDFIWASPECPSHSIINRDGNQPPRYPDMKLYQEIIFLSSQYWYKGKFCVENVKPYYTPLIHPTVELDRHLFWSNFDVRKIDVEKTTPIKFQKGSGERYGFSLTGKTVNNKRKVLRNLVNPEIGLHILNSAIKTKQIQTQQIELELN